MALPIHDHTSSVTNLARMMRDGLDTTRDMTSVRTATLKLILDTMIRLAEPRANTVMHESAQRSLTQMIAPNILDQRGSDVR